MANINVTPQRLVRGTGLNPTVINIVSTDVYFIQGNDGTLFLLFEGDATNPRNVTIVTPNTVDGNLVADVTVAIPATSRRLWGLTPIDSYGSTVQVSVDGTGVKMYALKL